MQAGSCSSNLTPSLGTSTCQKYGPKKQKKSLIGVPAVVRQDQQHLGSSEMQARLRGLRTQRCHSCSLVHYCGSNLIPGLGTSHARRWPKKKKKEKKFTATILLFLPKKRKEGEKRLCILFLKGKRRMYVGKYILS